MTRSLIGALQLLVAAAGTGCSSDTFACGDNGGECDLDTEVCVVAGGCSTCIPAPADCNACGCLGPANDETFGDNRCVDQGHCSEEDDGVSVTCAEADGWGCG